MRVDLNWSGDFRFEAHVPSGAVIPFDSHADHGGTGAGSQPMETLIAALAACTAMDVLAILQKKRQMVTKYRVEVDAERKPEGDWPRPFTKIVIRHYVEGQKVDEGAVRRAIELSDTKYCGVMATLKHQPEIRSEWVVN